MSKKKADIVTSDHGFAVSFYAITKRGQEWLEDNYDWPTGGLAEHRYATDIILGAVADGLHVQDAATGNFARSDVDV